jgi:hypothetical protein
VRQIHGQANCGHRILRGMRFVSDLDRKSEIRYADPIDSQFPVIGLVLGINKPSWMLGVHRSGP